MHTKGTQSTKSEGYPWHRPFNGGPPEDKIGLSRVSFLFLTLSLDDLSTGFTSHHWWMMRGVRESFSEEPPSPLLPTPPHREEKAPSLYLEILVSRKSVCCIAVVYALTASTVVGNPQIRDVPRQCFPFFAPGRANCWADCVPSVAGAGPLQQLAFGKFCRES